MKKFLVFSLSLILLSSCFNDEKQVSVYDVTEIRGSDGDQGLTNEEIVKIISIMVCDPVFVQVLNNSIITSQTKSSHSVSFMELLTGTATPAFCQKFHQACQQLGINNGLSKFINGNLSSSPNLCLSVYQPEEPSNQSQTNISFPVFSEQIFDSNPNNENYVFYNCGQLDNNLTTNESPGFSCCVIQEREGFVSLLSTQITDENYFNDHSKVKYLESFVNNTDFQSLNFNPVTTSNTLNLCGTSYPNPFLNRFYINDSILTTLYNTEASNSFYFPPAFPPLGNFLCPSGLASQRTTFNNSVNREFSHSIKLPMGNAVLELNNDWCAWWNKDCRFMVDLYIPSRFNSTTFEPLHLTKFFWYHEKSLKKKIFVAPRTSAEFGPWYYETSQHGDEWKYNWTGKHRKEGNTTTITLGAELGSTVGFKDDKTGLSASLTRKINAIFQTTRTNKDLFLGGDLVYWCDDILVNNNRGNLYSTTDVLFHIREKE